MLRTILVALVPMTAGSLFMGCAPPEEAEAWAMEETAAEALTLCDREFEVCLRFESDKRACSAARRQCPAAKEAATESPFDWQGPAAEPAPLPASRRLTVDGELLAPTGPGKFLQGREPVKEEPTSCPGIEACYDAVRPCTADGNSRAQCHAELLECLACGQT